MTDRISYLQEADRRGILPPEMKGALDEARKRGLVSQTPAALPDTHQEVGVGEDVAKSFGIGLAQGAIGLSTLPGNIEQLGRMGINAVGKLAGSEGDLVDSDTFLPNYGGVKAGIERKFTGKFYEPQTTAGEYARTIGEFAPVAVGGGAGLVNRATRVLVPAIGSETAGQMTEGTALEPWARLAGAMATGPALNAVTRPVRRAFANRGEQGAYGRIAESLPGSVDEFANEVAAGASRANAATNRRTLDILGEEMQRAGGDVPTAQAAAIARISREAGVTPQTAAGQIRRLTQVHRDSDLMLGEYPAVSASNAAQRTRQPGNIDLDELGRTQTSQTQATLDYLANNGNARSAQDVRNAIGLRQEQLAPSMRRTLEEAGPQVPTGSRTSRAATIDDVENNINAARAMARQEYDAAYNGPLNNPQRLQQLPRFLEYLTNRSASSAPEVAQTIRNAVNQVAVRLPDGSLGVQSLRQLQQGRTTIRGQMTALERSGRADLANEIRPFYNLLTRTMEEMSPQWGSANRRWADMRFDEVATELGDAFATKAGPQFRAQMREFQGMAPEAQNIVRIHLLQKLYDKLDNLGDTHSVSKLFSNDHSRNMIRNLFGDEAAVSFTRAVRDQKVAESSQRMLANSATHRRGQAQKEADLETGLVSAVENASARGVRNWLLERTAQLLTERRNRPTARILTTPISDTAQVSRHIHNMRTQQDRLAAINARQRVDPLVPLSAVTSAVDLPPLRGGSGSRYEDGVLVLPEVPGTHKRP